MTDPVSVEIRFRLGPTKRWRYGKLRWGPDDPLHDDGDGESCVTLIDYLTGGTRTISAKYVQKKTSGPRGGVVWKALDEGDPS